MAKPTYDAYAYSPLGERIAGGAHAYRVEGNPNSGNSMNIFWFTALCFNQPPVVTINL